jgi:hypothetical protein
VVFNTSQRSAIPLFLVLAGIRFGISDASLGLDMRIVMSTKKMVKTGLLVSFIAASAIGWAQDDAPPPLPQYSTQDEAGPRGAGPQAAPSNDGSWRRIGNQADARYQGDARDDRDRRYGPPPAANLPPQLTIAPGTFLVVRINQAISSDRNQAGDAFSATLVKPVVVNGVIVADRGQVIEGRVSEAQKAGRVQGTSRLGLELTDLTLIDGDQVPVRTQLITRNGSTSEGRDAVGIGAATGIGAIIGAGAAGRHEAGEGAAIGAGAGAAAGIIGVLLTRGNPTVIRPEQVLTFRLENPVTISTDRAPQAFRYVGPSDYQQPSDQPRYQSAPRPPAPYYYGGGYGVYGPWGPYYGYGYPYYYGPSIGIRFGGFYGGRYYGGGHFRR